MSLVVSVASMKKSGVVAGVAVDEDVDEDDDDDDDEDEDEDDVNFEKR